MMYFARITKQKPRGYLVEFPQLEGCLTEGYTLQEAKYNAEEALNLWLEVGVELDKKIPKPQNYKGRKNYYPIPVDLPISLALLLKQHRQEKGLPPARMAQRMGLSTQAYRRLEQPTKSNPTFKQLEKISQHLGVQCTIDLAA